MKEKQIHFTATLPKDINTHERARKSTRSHPCVYLLVEVGYTEFPFCVTCTHNSNHSPILPFLLLRKYFRTLAVVAVLTIICYELLVKLTFFANGEYKLD